MRSSVSFRCPLQSRMTLAWHRGEGAPFGRSFETGIALLHRHTGTPSAIKLESARGPLKGTGTGNGDSLLDRLETDHTATHLLQSGKKEIVPKPFGSGLDTNLSNKWHSVIGRLVR